jgi:hypothetical protein
VITLRLHREIYAGEAVDAAMKAFAPHAELAGREEPSHWIVEIVAKNPRLERRIAGELGNWALGLTVRRGGAA